MQNKEALIDLGISTNSENIDMHVNSLDQVKENKEAWKELQRFDKPTIALFGDNDKVFAGQEKFIIEKIPGANGLKHKNISAGHFSQEDQPEVLCEAILSIK